MIKWLQNWFRRRFKSQLVGHRVIDIAEQNGLYISEVEKALRRLQKQGKVEVFWFESGWFKKRKEMYVVFLDAKIQEQYGIDMFA